MYLSVYHLPDDNHLDCFHFGAISCSVSISLGIKSKNRTVCEFVDGLCHYTLPYITLMENYKLKFFYYIYLCACAREVVAVKEPPVRVSSLLLPEPFTWVSGTESRLSSLAQAPVCTC